jgi:peptide/nickel transport system substrate-binding protein
MATKNTKIIVSVVVVIILIVAAVSVIELYHPAPSHVFTDTSQTAAPDHLDPASGFFTTDEPLFTALYQELVEFNGSSNNVVPVLADHIYVQNEQNYTFDMRPYVNFTNGNPVNASDVWFSIYRGIVMGQGPFTSDYPNILFNATNYGATGIALPWGLRDALTNAGYTLSGNLSSQYTQAANILDYMLSNWNYNATNMKVMSYSNQAIVINSEYNLTVKAMFVYPFMEQDLAGWWGAVINPADVDSNGGVTYNTENSYLNLHGAIGTGPYEIKSVGASLSDVVIVSTPNYWATGHSSVPAVAKPAHIPEIVIDYGLSHTDRLEDFDKNTSMISVVGPSSFKSMITGFYNSSEANTGLVHSLAIDGVFYFSMNTQMNYTDNVHFRRAIIDANNYTAQSDIYANNYNGSAEAYNELGPLSPSFGHNYYNPNNASLQTMNLKYAIQNMTLAGKELNFYVVLPNGTKIGNTSGTDLSSHTFTITGISPATAVETSQITVGITSFAAIGLKFTSAYDTESTVADWTSPNSTPQFVDLGWVPDYPDPVGQQLIPVYDVLQGGEFGGNDAWVNNSTLQHYFSNLDFQNSTTQVKDMKVIYNITDNLSAYVWLPMPYTYYFVQPYVHGFVQNAFVGYFYNMMYISYPGGGNGSSTSYVPSFSTTVAADVSTVFRAMNWF